jgi:metal-dependent HD superfamily phosphatase/phosphodiesterase
MTQETALVIQETALTEPAPLTMPALLTLKDIRHDGRVRTYISRGNEQMQAIGYTEHGHRHAGIVSTIARTILTQLAHSEREAELAAIAGYLHDMGCVVNRIGHVEAGALIAFTILTDMKMAAGEIATIIGAIGNHEEPNGLPISLVSAAVIIADKSDVHFSRVQEKDPVKWDIHDRVNSAVQKSYLHVNADSKTIILDLEIDTTHASVTEYFEIFVLRMVLCRRAADLLGCKFHLKINGVNL